MTICRSALALVILFVVALLAPVTPLAQSDVQDIGIIIDNRPGAGDAATPDVDALVRLLDRHMFIDRILVLERPSIAVVCDVFSCPGRPQETVNPFPPLIRQITGQDEARLLIYYLGEGRIEGLSRQWLFKRVEGGSEQDVVPLDVDWLHDRLSVVGARSVLLVMDTSFTAGTLPCAGGDPTMVMDALLGIRQDFATVMQGRGIPSGHVELGATTPVRAPRCGEAQSGERSLFTEFLLTAIIEGEADREPFGDEDRLIDLAEIGAYLDSRLRDAAGFRWDRLQNVRIAGTGGQAIAAIDGRAMRQANEAIIERRHQPIPAAVETATPEPREVPEQQGEEDPFEPTTDEEATLSDETMAAMIDQHATAPLADSSVSCRWTSSTIGPYANTLMRAVTLDPAPSCAWAEDRSEVRLGPIGQVLTPLGWRLGRGTVKDTVFCLLGCTGTAIDQATASSGPSMETHETTFIGPGDIAPTPRSRTAFNLQICDRQIETEQPFYIGLPRWMPGTLMISEGLRRHLGCPPPPVEPVLPAPAFVAIDLPFEDEEKDEPCPEPTGITALERKLGRWPAYAVGVDVMIPELAPDAADLQLIAATSLSREACEPAPRVTATPAPSPAPEEAFQLSASQVRWLQSALTADSRNPGPIDGLIGQRTIAAVNAWRADRGEPAIDRITRADFEAIIREFGERFHQVDAIAQTL